MPFPFLLLSPLLLPRPFIVARVFLLLLIFFTISFYLQSTVALLTVSTLECHDARLGVWEYPIPAKPERPHEGVKEAATTPCMRSTAESKHTKKQQHRKS